MKPEQLRRIDKLVAEAMEPQTNWLALCPKCGHDWVFSTSCHVCTPGRDHCGRCHYRPDKPARCVRLYTTHPAASDTIVDWLLERKYAIVITLRTPLTSVVLSPGHGSAITNSAMDASRYVALALAFLESQGVEVPE